MPDPVLYISYECVLLYPHSHMKNRKVKCLAWGQQYSTGVQHTACNTSQSEAPSPELYRIFWKLEAQWTCPCLIIWTWWYFFKVQLQHGFFFTRLLFSWFSGGSSGWPICNLVVLFMGCGGGKHSVYLLHYLDLDQKSWPWRVPIPLKHSLCNSLLLTWCHQGKKKKKMSITLKI